MQGYWERLVWAMENHEPKMSQSDLAREVTLRIGEKVTPQAIQHLCSKPSDKTKPAGGSKHSAAIAEVLGVHPMWLAYGIGKPKRQVPKLVDSDLMPIKRVQFKLSAGVTGYNVEPVEGNGPPIFFRRDWFEKNGYRPEDLFAVRINGASMEPALFDGDLVVIDTASVVPKDGVSFAANYEGELVVKRLKRDAGEWWLASDNSDKRRFPDKRCDEHAILIGEVVYKQSERI